MTKHLHILILGSFNWMLIALRPPFLLLVHVLFAAGWSCSGKVYPDLLYPCICLIQNVIV